jgi:hypothetical protein
MKTKLKIRFLLFVVVLFSCLYQTAYAGFPVNKGNWLISPMYSHYSARNYWNDKRVVTPYSNNGLFTSHYFGVYGVFGIEKNLNFVFNVPYIIQSYSETNYLAQVSGLGDATAGIAYYFPNENPYKHISVTGSVILPLSQTSTISSSTSTNYFPTIGMQSLGVEAKLGYAGTNMNVMKNTYYDLEAGIRQYFAADGPSQIFYNATFGVPLDNYWKVSATLSGVSSSSSNAASSTTTSKINKDFAYSRFTVALGYTVSPGTSLWVNAFTDLSGRSIGVGRGFSVFAVFKF